MALLYKSQGRHAEAEPFHKESLRISEKAFGVDHPYVASALHNLAELYVSQSRYAEAEPLLKQGLVIREKTLGADHPDTADSLNSLAWLHFLQRDWTQAVELWRRSTRLAVQMVQRGTDDIGRPLTGKSRDETEKVSYRFRNLVKAGYRLAADRQDMGEMLAGEMFQIAQWARGSEAAASLAQMAARGVKGDAALSLLVRERQDLVGEWQRGDAARSAAMSRAADKRDRGAETANISRLAAIDARVAAIDARLVTDFPDYAALSRPNPLSVEEVQAQLRPEEALVLFLDTPKLGPTPGETFLWVITKSTVRWVRSDLGTQALRREVAALRCGLDRAAWDGESKCASLLKIKPDGGTIGVLPFDIVRAHALYRALFGEFEDLIADKHLLIVASGPLTQLPFHVLVSEQRVGSSLANADYRSIAWLARKHAITVLPAVASLKALRRVVRPSIATKPMIGFGNPLLDGNPAERAWEAKSANLAREKQACPILQRVAGQSGRHRGVAPIATLSGRADVYQLRAQMPLPETTDELCAVGRDLMATSDDIVLGAKATEANIKKLSSDGRLASYRIVHFATHGTLAGEISGTSEPGLILTPPSEQTETDDGYLSASEVASLKLDADWVILSACNTAAGGAEGAEALSGLARAFFYAGARALLVSHWAVDSAATVKLITAAVSATTHESKVGRAEALRRAMLNMIDGGEPAQAHPALWAPFVVVGEGGAIKN